MRINTVFHIKLPKRHKIRTKVIRYERPFIGAFRYPHCHAITKFHLRMIWPSLSSKYKKTYQHKHSQPPKKHVQKAEDLDTEINDQVMEDVRSVSEEGHAKESFPSPVTPGFVRKSKSSDSEKERLDDYDDVEDACKSFEDYSVEMIVDEGKAKDLLDVEELLHCWRNLRSPIFINLVCRFYGELCKDLVAPFEEIESTQETHTRK